MPQCTCNEELRPVAPRMSKTLAVVQVRYHRGLPYRADTAIGEDDAGILAETVTLAGVELPAGTRVSRDIDHDGVVAHLKAPLPVFGIVIPKGAQVSLQARPRSAAGWAATIFISVPFLALWVLALAPVELLRELREPERKEPDRPKARRLSFVAWPGAPIKIGDVQLDGHPGDRILGYRDGTLLAVPFVEQRGRSQ